VYPIWCSEQIEGIETDKNSKQTSAWSSSAWFFFYLVSIPSITVTPFGYISRESALTPFPASRKPSRQRCCEPSTMMFEMTRPNKIGIAASTAFCALLLAIPALAQDAAHTNWPAIGASPGNSQYSSL
jgi:hypothetical protein